MIDACPTGASRPADLMISRLLSLADVAAIAHRGGARLRPENTMAAFDHAVALGVDGVECDVRIARDGEPVLIHDATLDRTTDATGDVAGRTAAELARMDAGARFGADIGHPFRGAGVGVPRLAELLDRHPGLPLVIEIKGDRPDAVDRVHAVVVNAGASGRVLVGGFSHAVLARMRALAPDVPTSASPPEVRSAVRRAWFRLSPGPRRAYELIQIPFRFRGRRLFGSAFVRVARRAGIPVQVWIVDDEREMQQLVAWGVTGLISDRPDVAVAVAAGQRAAGSGDSGGAMG